MNNSVRRCGIVFYCLEYFIAGKTPFPAMLVAGELSPLCLPQYGILCHTQKFGTFPQVHQRVGRLYFFEYNFRHLACDVIQLRTRQPGCYCPFHGTAFTCAGRTSIVSIPLS